MNLSAAWVIGRGLLGAHLETALEAQWPGRIYKPRAPHPWHDVPALRASFTAGAAALAERVTAAGGGRFLVAWTAGQGVIGSPPEILTRDDVALGLLLESLNQHEALANGGMLFMASTAGGVWGGSSDRPITERSSVAPLTEYGWKRLQSEARVRTWLNEQRGWSALIGRISTLYGPGQNLKKAQGFISHVSRSAIFDRPINVFVSLDTLRDFLFVDDCAALVIESTRLLMRSQTAERCTVKILADERSVSLLQVVGAVIRVTKRHVRLTTSATALSAAQAPTLTFRSVVLPEARVRRTDLIAGVSRLHQHQLTLFQQGLLTPQ